MDFPKNVKKAGYKRKNVSELATIVTSTLAATVFCPDSEPIQKLLAELRDLGAVKGQNKDQFAEILASLETEQNKFDEEKLQAFSIYNYVHITDLQPHLSSSLDNCT